MCGYPDARARVASPLDRRAEGDRQRRQRAQPLCRGPVRALTGADHSCPCGHCHQTRALDPTLTSRGRSGPFLVGCHSFATSGATLASARASVTFRPAQTGQPLRCCTRDAIATYHSCDGSRAQSHHAFLEDPAGTSQAETSFRASCHSRAISGSSAPSEFVRDTRRFLQNGQPDRSRVRSRSEPAQTCSSPFGHFHQTTRVEPATIRSGESAPFRVGCHSATTSGKHVARLLVTETRRPAQNGHPVPSDVRRLGVAVHS
jgi:hypothetical protein